jgi:subtilisin family serine protease
MQSPLDQVRLQSIMNLSSGYHKIVVGIIDGPVNLNHPAFQDSHIATVRSSQDGLCRVADSSACMHGTFITGVLAAKRGTKAPGICPNCEILLYPIFKENRNDNPNVRASEGFSIPASTPSELSNAIVETIDAGAKIINLSLGLSSSSLIIYPELQQAYDYACKNNVILVAAAGNQGNIGSISLINHQWITPVVACDENGRFSPKSNYGSSIGNRGLMAPGVGITSVSSEGHYTQMSGTSVACPFVSGTIALLWSIFPNAKAAQILYAIRKASSTNIKRRSIVPPLLDAEEAWMLLENGSGKDIA